MKSDRGRWPFSHGPDFNVQLPWSDFSEDQFTKFFGSLIRCKLNVDQEE